MKIGAYISELLLQGHDSVVLPGFGEFYTKYSPAKFLPEEKKVESPSKTIAFNPDLKSGETPLIAYLAKFEYFDNDQIINYLGTFVEEIKNQLSLGKKVELEKVGVFHELPDGSIHFDPDRSINYLTQVAGFGSIPTPPSHHEGTAAPKNTGTSATMNDMELDAGQKEASAASYAASTSSPDTGHQNDYSMENSKRPELPPAVRWLAFTVVPVLLVLIILAVNYNYFFKDRKPASPVTAVVSDTLVTETSQDAAPGVVADGTTPEGQAVAQTPAAGSTPAEVSTTARPAQQASTGQVQQAPAAQAGRPVYYIVVGSFPDKTQAEAYAQNLRNQGASLASVFMRTGFNYHRVSYGYYYNLAEAEALLPDVQARINKEAYILHR